MTKNILRLTSFWVGFAFVPGEPLALVLDEFHTHTCNAAHYLETETSEGRAAN